MNRGANSQSSRLPGCSVLPPLKSHHVPTQNLPMKDEPKGRKSKTNGNRFATINNFVDFTLGNLQRNETAVWLMLWRDERDGISRTSMAEIGRRLKIDRRTAIRAVGRLEKRGLLEIVVKGSLNRGPSMYRVKPLERATATGGKVLSPALVTK